jgi:YVTN family beta-propeller protein
VAAETQCVRCSTLALIRRTPNPTFYRGINCWPDACPFKSLETGDLSMWKIEVFTTVCALLTSMPVASQTSRKHSEPCPIQTAPSGWGTYFDRSHGFCFSYPPTYKPVAQPWLKIYTNAPDKDALERLRKAAREHRLGRLQNKQDTTAGIIVSLEDEPFNLESFVARAPTGIDGPPERKQIAIPVSFGNPLLDIAFTPDGTRAYITCGNNNAIYVLDTATSRILGQITSDYPGGSAISRPT